MKIAIIGGGASGFACAVTLGRISKEKNQKAEITVFEANDRTGKKLLATGNGRCNMLNTDKAPFYFSQKNFHKFALDKFDADSNIEFFSSMGLYTREDEQGRVYPLSNQASTVLDFLRKECSLLGVRTVTDTEIVNIKKKNDIFILNDTFKFDRVVLACGGKAGVKKFSGYNLLKQLNHPVTEIKPSLTKVNTENNEDVKQLQGIRHKVALTLFCDKEIITREKGELLFAKYGLSGIAVMQLSAYIARMKNSSKISIAADFIPELSFDFVAQAVKNIASHNKDEQCCDILSGFMPKKLSGVVVKSTGINPHLKNAELSQKDINNIVKKAKSYRFYVHSLREFEDAQVTAGGADTAFFNEKTMESKKVKGFYAVGEVLDVDGLCGGYNLMWAWSSGRLCAESLFK